MARDLRKFGVPPRAIISKDELGVLKPAIEKLVNANRNLLAELEYEIEAQGERFSNAMALEVLLDNSLGAEGDKVLKTVMDQHGYDKVLKFLSNEISTY